MTECSSRRLAYFSCAIEDHFKKFFAKLNKLVIKVSFVSNFFACFGQTMIFVWRSMYNVAT